MTDGVSQTDGRSARRERNRTAVLDAYRELVFGGTIDPTFEQIAEHAGVSFRSVYRYFDNRDALKAAIAERALEWIQPLLESSTSTVAPGGPLTDRVDALIASRLAFFENIAEIARVASANHGSNAAYAPNIAAVRDLFREQVVGVFSPELAAVVDDTAELRITAITQIVSVPAIDFLFTAAAHTTEELSVVMRLQLLAVINEPSLKP